MSSTITKPRTLTAPQADSLLNVLKQPLAGRSVLVPFSNVAFVNGTLSPTLDDQGNEQVFLANQMSSSQSATTSTAVTDTISTATTATLQEAQEWLKQFSSSTSKKPAPTSQSSTKPKSALRKNAPTNPTTTAAATSSSSSSVPGDPYPTVPFVDIQEQYDPDGTQTSGTVVDVTQQLQQLMNPNSTVAAAATTTTSPSPPTTTTTSDNDDTFSTIPEPEPLKALSDQEYQDLSDRLEALARLEEEKTEDTNPLAGRKQPTASSSKKKKSSTVNSNNGWSKGFLLSSSSSSKKKAAPMATVTTKPAPSSTQPLATPVTTSPASNHISSSSTPASDTVTTSNPRSVTFDATPQVQEIPRIGTQRVPPKPTAIGVPTPASPPPTSQSSKPLETSMFSGVIQERSAVPAAAVVSPRMPMNAASRRNATTTDQPKRRSRFAQERQGNM